MSDVMGGDRVFVIWIGMKEECYVPNNSYSLNNNTLSKKLRESSGRTKYKYIFGEVDAETVHCKAMSVAIFATSQLQFGEMYMKALEWSENVEAWIYDVYDPSFQIEKAAEYANGSQTQFLPLSFSYQTNIVDKLSVIYSGKWYQRKDEKWKQQNPLSKFSKKPVPAMKRKSDEVSYEETKKRGT